MYNNYPNHNFNYNNQEFYPEAQDDRFFLAPFVVGGLAGTALGYGLANNNQLNYQNQPCCGRPMYFFPQQPMYYQYPYNFSSTSNNFYY